MWSSYFFYFVQQTSFDLEAKSPNQKADIFQKLKVEQNFGLDFCPLESIFQHEVLYLEFICRFDS